jgi:hypothetical protein
MNLHFCTIMKCGGRTHTFIRTHPTFLHTNTHPPIHQDCINGRECYFAEEPHIYDTVHNVLSCW